MKEVSFNNSINTFTPPEISFGPIGPSTGLSIKCGLITSELSTSLIICFTRGSSNHSSSHTLSK